MTRAMTLGDRVRLALVTCGGAGLFPFAPGTVGSLAATAIAWALSLEELWTIPLALVLTAIASIINVALGSWIERFFGGKDPGAVVIDECAGQWLALLPATLLDAPQWWHFAGAFFLFRAFDIFKPLGARQLERLPRGWGILLDDVLSGIYVAALGFAVSRWLQ